jgi:hypothetical protein
MSNGLPHAVHAPRALSQHMPMQLMGSMEMFLPINSSTPLTWIIILEPDAQ